MRSAQLATATRDSLVRLRVAADAIPIDTGGAMPDGFDAVIPIEDVVAADEAIAVSKPVMPGRHVRLPGDDVPPGVAVGWPGWPLRPVDCAALLASGCTMIEVVRRPRIAIIPSGDELLQPGAQPAPGGVIETNSVMIASSAEALGAVADVHDVVKDDESALAMALDDAIATADVVVLLAGSSVGGRDRGASAIGRAGTIDVRGVATRPARPVILGHAGAVALIDLPGFPVSCHTAFDAYVAPLLRRLGGRTDPQRRRARLSDEVETDGAFDEWHLATLLTAPGSPRAVVAPLEPIGGSLSRLAQAEARVHFARGTPRYVRHATVTWTPLRDDERATLPLFVGPYDPLIEELAALGGFRCRWTSDEKGEALEDGLADAVGVIVRDFDVTPLRSRAAKGRAMLIVGRRREGVAYGASAQRDDLPPQAQVGADPWEGAAAVAAGTRSHAPSSRYAAECFGVRFAERGSSTYAIVWEDRPGHRFPWAIVLQAALGAVAASAQSLGWESIGTPSEVK